MINVKHIRLIAEADIKSRGIVNSVFSIELLSNSPTHFDKAKGVKVKCYSSTIGGDMVSADIMEGEHIGKGTTCFENDLTEI